MDNEINQINAENQQDTLFEVIKNDEVTNDVKIKLPPRPVLTKEEKAQQLIKRGQHILSQVNVIKKKYRNRLLINYALMRLEQSKKKVENVETEILAWIEKDRQKKGKKGGASEII